MYCRIKWSEPACLSKQLQFFQSHHYLILSVRGRRLCRYISNSKADPGWLRLGCLETELVGLPNADKSHTRSQSGKNGTYLLFVNGGGDLYHSIGTRTMKQDVGSGVHNLSCCDRYQPFPPYLSVVLNPASLSEIRKYMYSSNLSTPFMITILQVSMLCIILYCGVNLNDNIFSCVVSK